MSVRQPVRLLDISRIAEAYPLELLANFTTGNFVLINSFGEQIEHNKPGKLTVKYGESVLVNAQDMSESIEFIIPEAPTDVSGNAGTATKLATAQNFTIGDADPKPFDGTAGLAWTLSEIGAAAQNHNHDSAYLGINANAVSASKLNSPVEIKLSGVTSTAQSFDGSADIIIPITSIPSSLLTGVIDLSLIPAGALERMVIVANDTARFALTTTEIQVGDIVKVQDTGLMYYVKDQSNLSNDNGYEVYTAGYATSVPWSGVTNKPNFATVATSGNYNDLINLPTIYQPSSSVPLANNDNGSVGTDTTFARADHAHPVQTTISGNAGSATKLATARNLTIGDASKSFDGTAGLTWTLSEIGAAAQNHNHDSAYLGINANAVSASKLATARSITIGDADPKSFDGTAGVTWTLSEIGAAAQNHNHNSTYLALSGGTISGNLSVGGTLTVSTAGNVSGISVTYNATVSTSWSGSSAPYTQNLTVTGIRNGDKPIVDFVCSGTYSTDKNRETAFANIYRVVVTGNNKITLYAHKKTTTSCPIVLFVIR